MLSNMHKWLVFTSAYLVLFVDIALMYNIGSIFVDVMETFNATRAETAVIHSTALGVGPSSGIVASFLISKFGITKCGIIFATVTSAGIVSCYFAASIWHMTVSFGIVYGSCVVNLFISSTMAISQHFHGRRRFLMLSLQATAPGMGGMIYPHLLSYLSSEYGFRGALLIIGGLSMNCIPCCFLWTTASSGRKEKGRKQNVNQDRMQRYQSDFEVQVTEEGDSVVVSKNESGPTANDIFYIQQFPVLQKELHTRRVSVGQAHSFVHQRNTGEKRSFLTCLIEILKNRYFVIFWIGSVLASVSLNLTLIFLADIYQGKNLTGNDATLGLMLMNIFNICGRIILGALMQMKCVQVLFHPFLATLMTSAFMCGLILAKSRFVTLLMSAWFGIPFGMLRAMFSVVIVSLVGVDDLPIAMGVMLTTEGILNFVAGPFSGYMRDKVGSYDIPFYVAMGISGFCAFVFMLAFLQQTRKTTRNRRRSSVFYLTSM